jgi:G patch domain-containing protein 1
MIAGIRLLQKMGWRQGKGIGKARAPQIAQGGSRWGTMASVGADNVAIHHLPPKDDTHGLGYDPFKVSRRASFCMSLECL